MNTLICDLQQLILLVVSILMVSLLWYFGKKRHLKQAIRIVRVVPYFCTVGTFLTRQKFMFGSIVSGDPHCTPLHAAVVSNFPKMLTLIIGSLITKFDDIRPFVNAEDGDGDTPLMWTIEKKLVARAKTLIDLGNSVQIILVV